MYAGNFFYRLGHMGWTHMTDGIYSKDYGKIRTVLFTKPSYKNDHYVLYGSNGLQILCVTISRNY